jgi:uncharacterized protein YdaU (DUF1376 family)
VSRPWMPLYVADYLADTAHLGAAESGAYLHLIMHYWLNGNLPPEDRKLARISRMTDRQWSAARETISEFFQDDWKHKRIDAELARAADISSKRRTSAEQRHSKSNANADANAQQLDTHARAGLPSPSPKEDQIAANAATTNGKAYAFENGIIRLTAKDLAKWEKAFSYLDLAAELTGLTKWAGEQGPENWFFAVSGALTKRNRDEKMRRERPANGQLRLTPSGNPWPEGIT